MFVGNKLTTNRHKESLAEPNIYIANVSLGPLVTGRLVTRPYNEARRRCVDDVGQSAFEFRIDIYAASWDQVVILGICLAQIVNHRSARCRNGNPSTTL